MNNVVLTTAAHTIGSLWLPPERLDAVVPNTENAISGKPLSTQGSQYSLWRRQRVRRAEVLRQARLLIGSEGYTAFSVRRLAGICALSPQTLYNLIGDREQLLSSAIGEHLAAMVSAASELEAYPYFFMAFWRRHLVPFDQELRLRHNGHAGLSLVPVTGAAATVHTIMREALCSALRCLEQRRLLRDRIDVALLTDHMESHIMTSALNWVEDGTGGDNAAHRRRLLSGLGFLLLGAMTASGRAGIEPWMDEVHCSH
jgi:AcrR family transcriptional regulator